MDIIKFAAPALGMLMLLAACDKEEYTGHSQLKPTNPTVSVEGELNNIIDEEEATYTYTVKLSEPQIVNVAVDIFQSGGTATEGEDYDLSTHRVIINALDTEATFNVTFYGSDADTEPEETLILQVGDQSIANATMTPVNINYTIRNVPLDRNDYIDLVVTWEGTYSFTDPEGTTSEGDLCDDIDIHAYIFNTDMFDANDDGLLEWSEIEASDVTAYSMTNGNCPETTQISGYSDGTYYVVAAVWSQNIPSVIDAKVKAILSQQNTDESVAVQLEPAISADVVSSSNVNATNEGYYSWIVVSKIVVTGGEYELITVDDVNLGKISL